MVVQRFDNQHPRFATIKSSSFANEALPCLFGEVKGKRLLVETEASVAASTTITVEFDDSLFLGEVITCKQEDAAFILEIKVEQVLSGLQSLIALRARLLSDSPVSAPGVSPLAPAFAYR